jgi:hypothetical protein
MHKPQSQGKITLRLAAREKLFLSPPTGIG